MNDNTLINSDYVSWLTKTNPTTGDIIALFDGHYINGRYKEKIHMVCLFLMRMI